jgi:hypothetical protein
MSNTRDDLGATAHVQEPHLVIYLQQLYRSELDHIDIHATDSSRRVVLIGPRFSRYRVRLLLHETVDTPIILP